MLQCILLKTTVITEGYILVERLDRNFTNILYWLEITVSTLALEFTIFHLRGVNFNISTHLLIREIACCTSGTPFDVIRARAFLPGDHPMGLQI